ncbi:MAG TPA: type II toxin-antitoxin system VapC family toxin [Allosphingosinicella sp.]|nr:type II toxin-antitoxin system VapC family toxin [Allosphingosinicella sp.]
MILLDTHVLVWSLQDDPALGPEARGFLDQQAFADGYMVSAITPWEIAMLTKKSRIILGADVRRWIEEALALPGMILAELEPAIAIDSVALPGDFHNDPADRIIIATARHHNIPLLTADRAILDYAALGHVNAIDARH